MAGVGFELKRLFRNKGFLANLKGYFISTIVTVGPTILCILLLIAMNEVLVVLGESYNNRQLFLATIVYCFAFSLIITGGLAMLMARYVSDCLFEKNIDRINPSLLGVSLIALSLAFITGVPFLLNSNIDAVLKIITYLIYAELVVVWLQGVYLSAVKHYLKIAGIFFTGVLTIALTTFILVELVGIGPLMSVLLSICIGFGVMVILFFITLYKTFGLGKNSLSNCFDFLKSGDKYWELLVLGLFYYLGIYGHNFVFWLSKESVVVENTYRFSPMYDLPVFYAFLTIIPAMVIFVVKVETSFYGKFREFYYMVRGNGSINDIKRTKEEMIKTLLAELRHMIEVQAFISFVAIMLGLRILPIVGFTTLSVDIFSILVLASLAYIIMYLLIIILLYFDDRKGAMFIALVFFLTSVAFSFISVKLGQSYYGFGFFFSSLLSMIIAFIRLNFYLKNIEYNTFGLQPIFIKEKAGVLSKAYKLIMKLESDKIESHT